MARFPGDKLYELFFLTGDRQALRAAVNDSLERLRLDYGNTDLAPFHRGIELGYVDAEEFNLARMEGERRYLEQDVVASDPFSVRTSNKSWNEDTDGYDGFLAGELKDDDGDSGDCLLS